MSLLGRYVDSCPGWFLLLQPFAFLLILMSFYKFIPSLAVEDIAKINGFDGVVPSTAKSFLINHGEYSFFSVSPHDYFLDRLHYLFFGLALIVAQIVMFFYVVVFLDERDVSN
jgi:hypothetical protein